LRKGQAGARFLDLPACRTPPCRLPAKPLRPRPPPTSHRPAEGLGLADVVKTTVWLGRIGDFAEFNRAYAGVFAATGAPAPARSTVRADLMMPGALVEIEAIARCRPHTGD
jgi:hypothetical protein